MLREYCKNILQENAFFLQDLARDKKNSIFLQDMLFWQESRFLRDSCKIYIYDTKNYYKKYIFICLLRASKFNIVRTYDLWLPKTQLELARTCFHFSIAAYRCFDNWRNEEELLWHSVKQYLQTQKTRVTSKQLNNFFYKLATASKNPEKNQLYVLHFLNAQEMS